MADVIVTLPKSFGLDAWIQEGDLPGEGWSGDEWHFYLGGSPPDIKPGERVYVTYNGKRTMICPYNSVEFHVVIKANASDFDGWAAENVKAFMDGIALVLAADQPPAPEGKAERERNHEFK